MCTIDLMVCNRVPNIPFFYLAFRCYSHWRGTFVVLECNADLKLTLAALKGSDHLDLLVDHRLFTPMSTPQIETLYEQVAPKLSNSFTFVTRSQVLEGTDPEEKMLLQPGVHKLIAESLEVPELAIEVERAVRQVKESLDRETEHQRRLEEYSTKEKDEPRK